MAEPARRRIQRRGCLARRANSDAPARPSSVRAWASLLVLASALAAQVRAEEVIDLRDAVETPAVAPGRPPVPSMSLTGLWRKRAAALAAGRPAEAQAAWNDLVTAMGFLGISRAEPFAVIELTDGIRRLESRDHDGAQQCFDRALKLDPQLWSVHHVQSVAALKRSSVVGLPEAIIAGTKAWSGRATEEESRYYLLLNVGLVLAIACALASTLLALGCALRHGARFRHDVQEFFGASFAHDVNVFLGWVLLLMPLLVWLGAFWATLYWLAVLVTYMSSRERVLAFLGLGMALASPLLQEVVLARAVPLISPPGPAMFSAGWGLSSVGARVTELWQTFSETDDVEAKRFLAYALRDAGRIEQAEAILEALRQTHPADADVLLDLGNLHFVTGNDNLAIHYYTKATTADPTHALSFYNLGLAYNKQMRLKDADSVKRKAEALDPTLVARVATRGGVAMMDARPTFGQILGLVTARLPEDAHARLRAKTVGAAVRDPFVLAAGGAVVVAILMLVLRRREPALGCERCGQPYCAQCKPEKERPGYCAACLHIYIKRQGIGPEARERKEAAIARFLRRRRMLVWVEALVAPGLSLYHLGKAEVGFLFMAVASVAVGSVVAGRTFLEPLQSFGQRVTAGTWTPLGILGVLWVLGLVLTWRALASDPDEA